MSASGATQSVPPAVQYHNLIQESQQLMNKIPGLEGERNEHQLVEETLKPLDGSRWAFRLVGKVLVEITVSEVLPSVATNRQLKIAGQQCQLLQRFQCIRSLPR